MATLTPVANAARSVYDELGVRQIVNARGATTAVGGTLMPPEVLAAMADAARAFVVLDDLNAAVGERIADVCGAAAGFVTSGSAAGMALAAAACVAGSDPALVRRLPDSAGLANEIVIHRAHRIDYDLMFRLGGGRLVEIGLPIGTEAWELEHAIGDRTAAVVWIDSPSVGSGALDFTTVVATAHARGVPVIVDAASTLPPVDHLRRWIRRGADLAIYSGGKGIRGPQDSGFIVGRSDLVAAARANASPRAAVGRGMKTSKEAIAGLWAAITVFLQTDHEAEHRAHRAEAELIAAALANRDDTRIVVEADWEAWPAPVVRLFPTDGQWRPADIRDALRAGDPSIHLDVRHGGLLVNTHCLLPGDAELIRDRLVASISAPAANNGSGGAR